MTATGPTSATGATTPASAAKAVATTAPAAVPIDAALAALADPVRRRTVELLSLRPHRAGELAGALGVTPPTMSKHLRVLRQAALVADTQPSFDTRVRVYALRQAPFRDLRRWLDDTERGWAEQLGAFAAHVREHHGH